MYNTFILKNAISRKQSHVLSPIHLPQLAAPAFESSPLYHEHSTKFAPLLRLDSLPITSKKSLLLSPSQRFLPEPSNHAHVSPLNSSNQHLPLLRLPSSNNVLQRSQEFHDMSQRSVTPIIKICLVAHPTFPLENIKTHVNEESSMSSFEYQIQTLKKFSENSHKYGEQMDRNSIRSRQGFYTERHKLSPYNELAQNETSEELLDMDMLKNRQGFHSERHELPPIVRQTERREYLNVKPRCSLKSKNVPIFQRDYLDEYDFSKRKSPDLVLQQDLTPQENGTNEPKPNTQIDSSVLEAIGRLYLMGELHGSANAKIDRVSLEHQGNHNKHLKKHEEINFEEQSKLNDEIRYLSHQNTKKPLNDNDGDDGVEGGCGMYQIVEEAFESIQEGERCESKKPPGKPTKNAKFRIISKLITKRIKAKNRESKLNQLRRMLWTVVYPFLFTKHIEQKVRFKKEEILIDMNDYIQICSKVTEDFLISCGEKFLRNVHLLNLICDTKSLELYCFKRPATEKALEMRINYIYTNLHGYFDKLISKTTQANLQMSYLRFLVSISENYAVPPHHFLFDFEIKRLQFNHFGNLKNMCPKTSKMIIGCFILLRILLYKIIMRPWTVFPDVTEKRVNKKNLLTVGSILYNLVISFIKRTVVIHHDNQVFLDPNYRVKPLKGPLKALDDDNDLDETLSDEECASSTRRNGPEGFVGFQTQEQLKCFFSDRKALAHELRSFIEGWHDKIYEITHAVYLQMPKRDIGNLVFFREKQ